MRFLMVIFAVLCISTSAFACVVIDQVFSGTLEAEEELFVRAFCHGYSSIPADILKIENLPARLRYVFNIERQDLHDQNKTIFFLRLQVDDTLAGIITFQIYQSDEVIYIRALAVDPCTMGKGIGRTLVFACKEYLPYAKKLVLATRKCNAGAVAFYKRLGFYEYNEVPYGWDPELFIGLKYSY